MQRDEAFEQLARETIQRDVQSCFDKSHPSLDQLLRLLAGESEGMENLVDHVSGCPRCTEILDTLSANLERESTLVAESVVAGSFSRFAKRNPRRWGVRLLDHLRRLTRETMSPSRLALAGAVAAAAVCLAILLPPALTAWHMSDRSDLSGVIVRSSEDPDLPDIELTITSPEDVVDLVDSMAEYDLARAMAMAIGRLNLAGVPLGLSAMAFDTQMAHSVAEGETWKTIAREELGDEQLWPILVLLNLDIARAGRHLSVGTFLRIPNLSIPVPPE